jgi:hypothetical protein
MTVQVPTYLSKNAVANLFVVGIISILNPEL